MYFSRAGSCLVSGSLTPFPPQSQELGLITGSAPEFICLEFMAYKSADDSFIHSCKKQGDALSLPYWPIPVPSGDRESPELSSPEQLWLEACPGTCTCAADDAIISSLEAFFPTKRLVIKSLVAAPDGRSHKLLTSTRPGVRSAWVPGRGIPVQKDFQKSGSTCAVKGGGMGEPRSFMPGAGGKSAGERPILGAWRAESSGFRAGGRAGGTKYLSSPVSLCPISEL